MMETPISNDVTCTADYQEVFDFTNDHPKKLYKHIAVQVDGAAAVSFTMDDGLTVAFKVKANASIAFDDFHLAGVLKVKDDGTGSVVFVNCW